ncbi:MAG TPA: acyl-CoA dehydrogenase family protein [Candidatus Limnocylindrales bacterium]
MTTAELRPAIAGLLADACSRLEALRPGDAFDPRVPAGIVAAGLHLLPVPGRAGGLGATMSEAAEVLAALGARDGSAALGFAMHVHSVGSIAESAGWPEAPRDRLYRSIVDDGALVNNASTEEGGGSPARGAIPGTVARPDAAKGAGGHAGWRLTGEKTWTTWLPALRYAFVSARIEDGRDRAERTEPPVVGTFLVDLEGDGVERRAGFEAMGMRGSASGRLVLDDVRVPGDALVSRRVAGEPDPRSVAPGAWFAMAVAATYLGVGEGVRGAVARWALDRRPGDGSTAVADIPTVQLRLGRLDAALRAARIVLFDATRRWDAATRDAVRSRTAIAADLALAKVTATNAAVTATDEAMRIAGGPGFLAGPIERAFRDARAGLINPPLDDVALAGFGRAVLEAAR